MSSRPSPTVRVLDRPARRLAPHALEALVDELRDVAATCFDDVPRYAVLAGDPDALDRAVLTLARDPAGRLVGFCAALRLPVPGVGDVLHLGLTCVRPEARSGGLTHRLLARLIAAHLVRQARVGGFWFTNTASVLSSLGNVALHFEDVHPSPYRATPPSEVHRHVARTVAAAFRDRMHVDEDAPFCADRFVFVGANRANVFRKSGDDRRWHHRDADLTRWYARLADLDGGDAVLQVGRVSVPGLVAYGARRVGERLPGLRRLARRPVLALPVPA